MRFIDSILLIWHNKHKGELIEVWNMLQTRGEFKIIEPLE